MLIGLLTDLRTVNSIYRGLPILRLQERGHELRLGMDGGRRRLEELRGCDVVHVFRAQDPELQRAATAWRAGGTGLVWDNDDDLTDVPGRTRTKLAGGALRSQEARTNMTRMLRIAHVVTTPSAVLAERYREWGAEHVEVVENFLPQEYPVDDRPRPRDGITIGWTAGEEHHHDMVKLGIRDTLMRLLEQHADVHVASIGLDLGIPHERYRHRRLVQYADLSRHVAEFDVGIAPLADIGFNRARSNVKLKEYAAAGVPWLASPIGPYAGLGEREGGQLVADDEWHAALDRLVRDARRRRKLAKHGRKWAERQTLAVNIAQWERALTLAAERARIAIAS
jgi:glycosyltransferase involved in cell wall biosynthesis